MAATHHPAVEVGVGPVADHAIELGVQLVGRPLAVAWADDDARAEVVERLRLEEADGRQPPAVRRPGRVIRPAARGHDLARLAPFAAAAIHVDGPDRRAGDEIRLRAAIGREGDGLAVRVPGDVEYAPVASRHLARLRAGPIDDEQVRPPIAVALAVPAPVGPGDPAGARLGGLGRGTPLRAAAGADRGHRADQEPGRVDFRGVREAAAVGRPRQLGDGAVLGGPREPDAGIRSRDVEQGDRGGRIVVGGVGADERQAVTVGR